MCDCGSNGAVVTDYMSGDVVCTSCGVVVESCIFLEVGRYNDAAAAPHPAPAAKKRRVLQPIQDVGTRADVARRNGFAVVEALASRGRFLDTVTDAAKQVYADFYDARGVRGESDQELVAACALYNACKIQGVPRTPREMAASLGVSSKPLNSTNKRFLKALGDRPYIRSMLSGARAEDLINRNVDALPGLDDVTRRALKSAARTIEARHSAPDGETPTSTCMRILELAATTAGVPITQTRTNAAVVACP